MSTDLLLYQGLKDITDYCILETLKPKTIPHNTQTQRPEIFCLLQILIYVRS